MLFKFGVQIFGGTAINLINYQADIILIGYFLTEKDVGYYAVAVAFSKFFWIIPQAIQTITYPITSEYWTKKNHSMLQSMLSKSMKYSTCALLPIGLGVGFFAKDIITHIFGGDFIHAVLPLYILIVGTVVFGVFKSIGSSLTGAGRPDIGLKAVLISATTNVILNVMLIPVYGISGAAVATTASLFVYFLLGMSITVKILNFKIDMKWYGKIIGMTILAILIFMNYESVNTYLLGILLLCIYLLMICVLFLTEEDRKYFKEIFRRV